MERLQQMMGNFGYPEVISVMTFLVLALYALFQNKVVKSLIFLSGYLLTFVPFLIAYFNGKGGSLSLGFTSVVYMLCYMMISMIMASNMNYGILFFTILTTVVDFVLLYRGDMGTSGAMGSSFYVKALLSLIIGAGIGFGYFFALYTSKDKPSLLYFFEDLTSKNKKCSIASNKKFKCAVYKNGEMVRQLS